MSETSSETTCTDCNFSDLYREEESYWWSAARRRLVNRFIGKYSPSARPRIIDVGCGGGGFLSSLKGHGALFGLEQSALGAAYATAKIGAKIVRGDAGALPFKGGNFDVLTSLDVVEHLDDDGKALRGFYRVLTAKGIMILTMPALSFLWSSRDVLLGHKKRYTVKELKLLLEKNGFKVIRCSYMNSFYFPALLFYSLFTRVVGRKARPKTLFSAIPGWLAAVFSWILRLEEDILMNTNLPIGTSIFCVAEKRE